jgi:hypothetical protein
MVLSVGWFADSAQIKNGLLNFACDPIEAERRRKSRGWLRGVAHPVIDDLKTAWTRTGVPDRAIPSGAERHWHLNEGSDETRG